MSEVAWRLQDFAIENTNLGCTAVKNAEAVLKQTDADTTTHSQNEYRRPP